jgi:hypothetical protein
MLLNGRCVAADEFYNFHITIRYELDNIVVFHNNTYWSWVLSGGLIPGHTVRETVGRKKTLTIKYNSVLTRVGILPPYRYKM